MIILYNNRASTFHSQNDSVLAVESFIRACRLLLQLLLWLQHSEISVWFTGHDGSILHDVGSDDHDHYDDMNYNNNNNSDDSDKYTCWSYHTLYIYNAVFKAKYEMWKITHLLRGSIYRVGQIKRGYIAYLTVTLTLANLNRFKK